MSPSKGHGLEPEDVDLIFPDSPAGSPTPITRIDFKRRASGEKDDFLPKPDEEAWPVEDLESENAPPAFEEPWPSDPGSDDEPDVESIEGLEDPPAPDPDEEVDLDPGRERRTAVQELGKATGRSMIDGMADPKPKALVRVERKKLSPLPSDREWFLVMRKIYRGELPAPAKGK